MKKSKEVYAVEEIRGECSAHQVGNKIVIESDGTTEKLNLEETDAVCMGVIDSMWNRMTWQGAEDDYLRFLAGVVGECRIACPHPGKPYTSCGTTIFRITREGFRTFTPNPDEILECPSWGPPTCEGKVVFRLEPVPNEEPFGDDYYKTLADLGHSMIPEYYLKNYASEETQQKRAKLIQE